MSDATRTSEGRQAATKSSGSRTAWWAAVRPRTLGAAGAPVLVGLAAATARGPLDAPLAAATLACALGLQVAANLANELGDALRGADGPERLGPLRPVAAGLLAPRAVRRALLAVSAAAAAAGLPLLLRGGVPLLLLGLAALASAWLYTLGPAPLAYLGLGEPAVWFWFGPVAVGGSYLLQTGTLAPPVLWQGLAAGLWFGALLTANNLRDAATDARVGKRTLVVRWGGRGGLALFHGQWLAGYGACGLAAGLTGRPGLLLPLLLLPGWARLLRSPATGSAWRARFGRVAALATLSTLALAPGWWP